MVLQQSAATDSALAELLFSYTREDFLAEFWTKKSLFIPVKDRRSFQDIFTWRSLNNLLNFHDFSYPNLRLAKNGEVLDSRENINFLKHCQEGATLIIDHVNQLVPEVAAFAAKVQHDLGHPLQVNMYCSCSSQQGFKCHYDTHEVFILQVEGSKQWYVFPETVKYPLKEQKSAKLEPPQGDYYLSCILNPGDFLYIPRGHWHYAKALDQPSLHLTLGVHCLTGISLLEWLTNELKQSQLWRENLPILSQDNLVSVTEKIDTLVKSLVEHTTKPNFANHYIDSWRVAENVVEKYAFPYQVGAQIFKQGINTRFTRPLWQEVNITTLAEEQGYSIRFGTKEVILKGVPLVFIKNLFAQPSFTGVDVVNWLPDFDWELDLAPVLSRLVTEGIIFVV